jgi:hypothetical protein
MSRGVFVFIFIVFIAVIAPASPCAASDASVRVTPNIAMEGTTVFITVRITPEPSLRGMVVETDSLDFFRSSFTELSGSRSAAVHTFELRSLPAGIYAVRVLIDRAAGAEEAEESDAVLVAKFRILG